MTNDVSANDIAECRELIADNARLRFRVYAR